MSSSQADANVDPPGNLKCEIKPAELKDLMEYRGEDARKHIDATYGSTYGLCQKIGVNPAKGLSMEATGLETRRARFGSNRIPMKRPKNIFQLAWEAMKDTTLIILMIAAIVSIVLPFTAPADPEGREDEGSNKAWLEGCAILLSIVVVVCVTALNNYSKEKQFQALKSEVEAEHDCFVMRDGNQHEVKVQDLVVGDILLIKYGNTIPADGILVQSSELRIDESSLTGECELVKKCVDKDPILLSGTQLMEGSGKMLITAVGLNSQAGMIMVLMGAADKKQVKKAAEKVLEPEENEVDMEKSLRQSSLRDSLSRGAVLKARAMAEEEAHDQRSLLRSKLEKLATQISFGGLIVACCIVVMLIIRFSVSMYLMKGEAFQWYHLNYWVYYLIVGVTLLVVAVPEGLPLAITLTFAYSARQMLKDHNLVRHIDHCETMGSCTTICSDKTGTLTTNRMTVVQSYINGTHYTTIPEFESLDSETRSLLIDAIAINCSYSTQCIPSQNPAEQAQHVGNKTECALLGFALALGQEYDVVRRAHPEESFHKVFTFNSIRKSMTTVIPIDGGGFRVFTKGASEILLQKCKWQLGSSGLQQLSGGEVQRLVSKVVEPMASDGLRTICLAYKDYKQGGSEINWDDEAEINSNLTMIAIVGIQDPVRPEVPEAVKQCQEAGIVVRMVTGDNKATARSIALSCGILKEGDGALVLEGNEFNALIRDPLTGIVSQDRLDKVWPRLRVLARAQPTDKYDLVKGIINSHLTTEREVVAVTGDGTNDAPALKAADVGFSMGIAGTDVAKQACDIILTDDNFSSIVKAVVWGRNIFENLSKSLQFKLTTNVVAVTYVFVCTCTIQDSPLRAVQMLCINLIMDTLGSLALATENPTSDLLKRKPRGRKKALVTVTMGRNVIGQAIYQLTILFALLFAGPSLMNIEPGWGRALHAPPTEHFTLIYNSLVIMILFNEINVRRLHGERNVFQGIYLNRLYCAIWVSTLALQVIMVEFGGTIFSTAPLLWWQWIISLALGFGGLIWHQIVISIPIKIFRQPKVSTKEVKIIKAAKKQNASDSSKALKASKEQDVSNSSKTLKASKDQSAADEK